MRASTQEFNQIAYQNDYIKEKYDRINLTVPKGRKEEIKKKAATVGKSVNEYINGLIDNDIK
jgi:predicted DNA binding CopG/RHH family protein